MNKAFKKSGKKSWINSRYSMRYKRGLLIARVQIAQLLAHGNWQQSQVRCSNQGLPAERAMRVAEIQIKTIKAAKALLESVHLKWRAGSCCDLC